MKHLTQWTGSVAGAAILAAVWAPAPAGAQVPVLIYHAHGNLGYSEPVFRQHMDFLRDAGYSTITPDQLYEWKKNGGALPFRPVLITVDDNYIDVYTGMFPILRDRGQVGVNFTITGSAGADWGTIAYCSWDQVREMEQAGVFLSESHTVTHPFLAEIAPAQRTSEITASRAAMAVNMPGKDSLYIAYPYGSYNAAVIADCMAAGYRLGFSILPGKTYRDTPDFEIPRIGADGIGVEELKTALGYHALPPAPPGPGWTIDDADPNFDAGTAPWQVVSPGDSSTYGATHHVLPAGTGGREARWAVSVSSPLTCRIYARWTAAPDRAPDALYTITHAGGSTGVPVSQQANGSQWQLLGLFEFNPAAPVQVTLRETPSGSLSADALWLEPLPSARVEDYQLY